MLCVTCSSACAATPIEPHTPPPPPSPRPFPSLVCACTSERRSPTQRQCHHPSLACAVPRGRRQRVPQEARAEDEGGARHLRSRATPASGRERVGRQGGSARASRRGSVGRRVDGCASARLPGGGCSTPTPAAPSGKASATHSTLLHRPALCRSTGSVACRHPAAWLGLMCAGWVAGHQALCALECDWEGLCESCATMLFHLVAAQDVQGNLRRDRLRVIDVAFGWNALPRCAPVDLEAGACTSHRSGLGTGTSMMACIASSVEGRPMLLEALRP